MGIRKISILAARTATLISYYNVVLCQDRRKREFDRNESRAGCSAVAGEKNKNNLSSIVQSISREPLDDKHSYRGQAILLTVYFAS